MRLGHAHEEGYSAATAAAAASLQQMSALGEEYDDPVVAEILEHEQQAGHAGLGADEAVWPPYYILLYTIYYILLYMCSYCYICVLVLLYMCVMSHAIYGSSL